MSMIVEKETYEVTYGSTPKKMNLGGVFNCHSGRAENSSTSF